MMVASLLSEVGLSARASRSDVGPGPARPGALGGYSEGYAGPEGEERGGLSMLRGCDRGVYPLLLRFRESIMDVSLLIDSVRREEELREEAPPSEENVGTGEVMLEMSIRRFRLTMPSLLASSCIGL